MGIATQTSDGLKFSTTYMYVKNSSGTTLASIKSDGKFAIGGDPVSALTVHMTGGSYGSDATSGFIISNTSSGRATQRIRSVNNEPAELFIDVNGAARWDFSCRNSASDYKLNLYNQAGSPSYTAVSGPVMTWLQNGNVGIGTDTPAFSSGGSGLEIERTTATLRLQHAGSHASEIYQNTSAFNIADLSSGTIVFKISNAEKMRLNSTGLGIGTNNPGKLLQLEGGGLRLPNGYSIDWNNENTRILASHASQYIRMDIAGTSNVMYATPTYVSFNREIIAGTSATGGGSWLEKNYTGSNKLNVLSSKYSSGNTIIGYGAKGKSSSGGTGYVATYGNFSGNKSIIELSSSTLLFKVTDSPAQDTIGDDITLNQRLAVDKDSMTFTSSAGSGFIVNRTSVTGYLQFYPAYSTVPTIMGKGAGGLHLGYNSNTAGIRIDTSNIVGINTTAPNSGNSTKLDVRGSIYFDNNALITSMGGENSNVDHIWHDDNSYDGAGGAWNFVSDGTYKQAGNSRLYAGHVYMAGSGTNYFNGAITANSNLTLSGSLLGISNSSLSQIGNIILDTNGEDLPVINHQLNNDLALMDAKGGTVTYGGLSSTPGSTANAFRSNSSFLDVTSSTISNSSNGFTITLESLPRTLTYSTRVGITFLHDGWRCSYVKIEVYRAGAWTQIREETSNTKATVYQFYNTSSSGITKIRYTLKNPATTSIRIVSLFAFNYNSTGNSGYFLSQAGGDLYGSLNVGPTSSGTLLEVGNDGNTDYALIGPTKIGGGMGHGDYAGFSHRDRSTTTSYALLQHTAGTTYLNSNVRIYMGVNNANYTAQVESDRFQVNNKLHVNGMIKAGIAGNASANTPALLVSSAGVNPNQSAIAIQQGTTEGDTIIFADYEPHVEWGLSTDNGLNTIEFTAGTSTNNLGSKTLYNQSGSSRTAYKKAIVELASGNMYVGGSLGVGTTSPGYKLDVISSSNTTFRSITTGTDRAEVAIVKDSGTTQQWTLSVAGTTNGYSVADKYFYIADTTGGTTPLVIDKSGNVGIGTVSPTHKLEVIGNSYIDATSAMPTLSLGRYNGQQSIKAASDDGGYLIMDSNGGRAALNWYSSDHVVLALGGGNVGIGTATAYSPLQVYSTADQKILLSGSTNPYIRWQNGGSNRAYIQWIESGSIFGFFNQAGDNFDYFTHDSTGAINLRLKGNDGDIWGSFYAFEGNSAVHEVGILDGDQNWAARHINDTSWDFRINNQSRMFINSSGCVGIGTASPASRLDVKANIRIRDTDSDSTHVFLESNGSEGVLRLYNGANWGFIARGTSNNPYIGAYSGGALHVAGFTSSNGSSYNSALTTFDFANQRVGINTGTPSADLTIFGQQNLNGTIRCTNGYNSNTTGFWLKLMLNDNTTYWYPPDGATSGNWTKLTKRDGTETVLYGANVQTFVQTSSKTSNGTVVLDGAYGQCIDVDISNGVSITGFSYGSSLNGDMVTNGAETIILILRYNGTASVTWTATDNYLSTGTQTIQWSGGTAPTLTQVAGKADIFAITHMNYATWFGSVVAQNVTYT